MTDRGSVTIWILGLCLLVLTLGGLSIDLWRGISERRALYHMASAGSLAGSSAIDTETWRESGVLRLDAETAEEVATAAVFSQPGSEELNELWVRVGETSIEVEVARPLEFTLLRLVGLDQIVVRAWAQAEPQVRP